MPTPILQSSPSVSIPPVHIDGDAMTALSHDASPPTVTIGPVYIEGDASSAQRLVQAHDAGKAPRSCLSEAGTAAFGAIEVAGAVGATVLGAALGPLGVGVGLAAVAGLSYSEGQKLRALSDCATE